MFVMTEITFMESKKNSPFIFWMEKKTYVP